MSLILFREQRANRRYNVTLIFCPFTTINKSLCLLFARSFILVLFSFLWMILSVSLICFRLISRHAFIDRMRILLFESVLCQINNLEEKIAWLIWMHPRCINREIKIKMNKKNMILKKGTKKKDERREREDQYQSVWVSVYEMKRTLHWTTKQRATKKDFFVKQRRLVVFNRQLLMNEIVRQKEENIGCPPFLFQWLFAVVMTYRDRNHLFVDHHRPRFHGWIHHIAADVDNCCIHMLNYHHLLHDCHMFVLDYGDHLRRNHQA